MTFDDFYRDSVIDVSNDPNIKVYMQMGWDRAVELAAQLADHAPCYHVAQQIREMTTPERKEGR